MDQQIAFVINGINAAASKWFGVPPERCVKKHRMSAETWTRVKQVQRCRALAGSHNQVWCANVRKPSKEPAVLPEKQSHLTNLAEDAKHAQEHESAALFQITKSLSKFVPKQVPGVRMRDGSHEDGGTTLESSSLETKAQPLHVKWACLPREETMRRQASGERNVNEPLGEAAVTKRTSTRVASSDCSTWHGKWAAEFWVAAHLVHQ